MSSAGSILKYNKDVITIFLESSFLITLLSILTGHQGLAIKILTGAFYLLILQLIYFCNHLRPNHED